MYVLVRVGHAAILDILPERRDGVVPCDKVLQWISLGNVKRAGFSAHLDYLGGHPILVNGWVAAYHNREPALLFDHCTEGGCELRLG